MPESMIGLYKIQPFVSGRTISLGQAVVEKGLDRSGFLIGFRNQSHES